LPRTQNDRASLSPPKKYTHDTMHRHQLTSLDAPNYLTNKGVLSVDLFYDMLASPSASFASSPSSAPAAAAAARLTPSASMASRYGCTSASSMDP
jgi:hypothetical protein